MKPSALLKSLRRSVPRDQSAPSSLIEGTCLLKLRSGYRCFVLFGLYCKTVRGAKADMSFGRRARPVGSFTSETGN